MLINQPSNALYHTRLFGRLLLALAFLSFSRMLLLFSNFSLFGNDLGILQIIELWLLGLRFDVSTLFMVNGLYIVLAALPFKFRNNSTYARALAFVYFIGNGLAIALNFIDAVYFPFNLKRLTGDIFGFLSAGDNFWPLLPRFILDFWPHFIGFWLYLVLFIWLNKLLFSSKRHIKAIYHHFLVANTLLLVAWLAVSVLGIRGGFQLKPISLITAAQTVESRQIPIIVNTPFTLIKTFKQQGLTERAYFSDEKACSAYFTPLFTPDSTQKQAFKPTNVVVIIMESFSNEHSALMNPKPGYLGFTPFFDSLASQGLLFYGYANGKRSIEGIPAITASLPALMDQDFITSVYASNKVESLASYLGSKGYTTTFYHGGNNGTMGFDAFARLAGFKHYKGRKEYANDAAFDGKWGIFDEPFLKYVAHDCSKTKQPFLSVVFTLSSHHPYTIPAHLKGKFRKGKLPIQEAIMYADYALKTFFEKARQTDWFDNTLFVITADHSSEAYSPEFNTTVGQYAIPILFYMPTKIAPKKSPVLAQQTDIMPTILHLINYDKPFLGFGKVLTDTTTKTGAINYLSGNYHYITDSLAYVFNGDNITACYRYKDDILLKNNILQKLGKQRLQDELYLKAFIQSFNHRMIHNQLSIHE